MTKKKLPFRIGATSYVYPDDILPNVRKLKDKIDDVELVLFEADNIGNIPTQKCLKELKSISDKCSLTYTIHLPLDINLGSEIDGQRKKSIERTRAFIDYLSFVNPYAYILHLNLHDNAPRQLNFWQDRVNDSLKQIIKGRKAMAKNIAIENLRYPFSYAYEVIKENNCAVCVDIGHLVCAGVDPLYHLKKYFRITRVIHLYGVNGRKDHLSLKYLDTLLLKRLFRFLRENVYRGVLTLEVFSQADFEESSNILWENLYS